MMKTAIKLTQSEIRSTVDRVTHAEGLILQLPPTHAGRNAWLLEYGKREESRKMRADRGLSWDEGTEAVARTASGALQGDDLA